MGPATAAELVLSRTGDTAGGLRFEGSTVPWAEAVAAAVVRAALLRDLLHPARPPHVGVLLENVPEFVYLLGGAALSGSAVVGLNPTRRGEELARDVRHTDCQIVLTDAAGAALLHGLDTGAEVLTVDGDEWAARVAAHAGASVPASLPGPDDLFVLLFTSGSTGAPKAVRMTQGRAARTAVRTPFTPADVTYCAMPLFHGNALLSNLFPAMLRGATVVLRRKFSASAFLPDVRAEGATFFNTIGRALAHVLATPETADDRDHRLAWVLAPEASPADARAFRKRFGVYVVEGYGSSENAIILEPAAGMPSGSLGRAPEGADIAVVDPKTGEERPRAVFDDGGRLLNAEDAVGELVGRNTAAQFEGYYRNAEAEAERVRDGWYWSGDLAYQDADGWFWFAGRAGDWLRVDGENFAAAPVERVLARCPGVAGVAVYGVPEPTGGDRVMAAIEVAPGSAFDPDSLDAFLATQRDLGTKWAPSFVRILDALPLTGTGKIDKRPLREARWAASPGAVWWRAERGGPLVPLTGGDAAALDTALDAAGRASRL